MRFCTTKMVVILLVLIYSGRIKAQTSLEGEIRPRFELRDGFKMLRDSVSLPAVLITQRSRIILNYSKNNVRVKLSFQDVRVWGDEKLKTDVPSTAMHEGWLELPLIDSLNIRAGRQEIYYDNQRIMSNSNWLQTGASHDALVLRYHKKGIAIDIGSAFNQLSDATIFGTDYSQGQGNYKALNYIWVTKKTNLLNISGFFIADAFQLSKDTMHTRFTEGTILLFNKNQLSFDARIFYQGGKTITGQGIQAMYLNADLAYKFQQSSPSMGFEYFSGNNNSKLSDSHYHAFNYLYGTGQKFNGHMGYFLRPESTRLAGLLDIYLSLKKSFTDKFSCIIDYHYFTLPNDYKNPQNQQFVKRYLAIETDISSKYDISKEVQLQGGYSFLKASQSMEIMQGRGDSKKLDHWFYIMLTVKPTFY